MASQLLLPLLISLVASIALFSGNPCFAADPTVSYDFKVSYITASPLGVPQQVIAVNGQFPGPVINATTNYNVVVNVINQLDEGLLMTWQGIQMRRASWQDGVRGTNCPIQPKRNFTYNFQVKDQIGSFFYYPSLHLQRASGGFGAVVVNNREVISIPFLQPDGDINLLIGDWYTQNHTALRGILDAGKELGMPDGVLINGKGPFKYNSSVPDGIKHETINVDPGKTYRLRVHNVGTSTTLNLRIQGHSMILVETEGRYTIQQNYSSFDIHVGQSYSFLVTMDQDAASDYYIVASARYVNESVWQRVTGVAVLHYSNSKGPARGPLPDAPSDIYNQWSAMNQAKSIRQNTTASGARPNPQGSFRYGSINTTKTYILRALPPVTETGGKRRRLATLNGISFKNPDTPIRLADVHKVKGVYKLDFPAQPLAAGGAKVETSVVNATYRGFVELILQNNDTKLLSFHLDGYSLFVVGMDWGIWSESKRDSYNKWDAISRSTVEVHPGSWTAVYASLDNVGVWNLRVENLDRWYLGLETYLRIVNPEENGETELAPPDNVVFCGQLQSLEKASASAAGSTSSSNVLVSLVIAAVSALLLISV
ncbi:Monocopper oxidase-like protein SKS2 [Linum grandiflorum]